MAEIVNYPGRPNNDFAAPKCGCATRCVLRVLIRLVLQCLGDDFSAKMPTGARSAQAQSLLQGKMSARQIAALPFIWQ